MVMDVESFWYPSLFVTAACLFWYFINYLVYSRQISKWKESNIPFLRPIFPFGHKYLWNVGTRTSLAAALDRIYRENKHQDVLGYFMGTYPVILILNRELMQQIFVKNSDKTFPSTVSPLSNDIESQSTVFVSSDKQLWQAGRKSLAPIFRASRIGAHFEKFEKQLERTLAYAEDARCAGKPLDFSKIVQSYFIDSSWWWHFGERTNSLAKRTAAYEAYFSFVENTLWRFITFVMVGVYPSSQKIGFGEFKLFRFFPKKIFDNMRSVVEQKLKIRTETHERDDNIVEHLVSLKEKGFFTKQTRNQNLDAENLNEMTLRQMTGFAWSAFIGTSTSGYKACMSAVHLLSLHPEYQDRIKREIDEALEKHNVSKLTFEVTQDLRFTEQCVYEATRLITETPFLARRCTKDFQVPGTKYIFREGDYLGFCPYSSNHDPKYFSDPEKFRPERFDSVESWSTVTSDALLSFGIGPRKCPGYTVGVRLVVMFLAALLSKYQIKPRSHLKQMTTPLDFQPDSVLLIIKGDLFVDLLIR